MCSVVVSFSADQLNLVFYLFCSFLSVLGSSCQCTPTARSHQLKSSEPPVLLKARQRTPNQCSCVQATWKMLWAKLPVTLSSFTTLKLWPSEMYQAKLQQYAQGSFTYFAQAVSHFRGCWVQSSWPLWTARAELNWDCLVHRAFPVCVTAVA